MKLNGLTDPYNVLSLMLSLRDSHKASREKDKKPVDKPMQEEEVLSPDDWQLLLAVTKESIGC